MIQMRSPKVVLPIVKCVRQLQYLVFARDSDADLVSHRVLCSTVHILAPSKVRLLIHDQVLYYTKTLKRRQR